MVCSFGLGPEAVAWIASTGGSALKGFKLHRAVADADTAVPWWTSAESAGIRGAKGPSLRAAAATNFTEAAAPTEKKEEGSGCFPPSATAYVKGRGPVCVGELQAGDHVLCGDASSDALSFSPFVGHLHFEPSAHEDYLAIQTTMDSKVGSPLLLTPEHLIFAARSRNEQTLAVRAGELREGDWLCRASCDGDLQRAQILKVTVARGRGRCCPLTRSGTIVVEGCLCSCYVDPFVEDAPAWLRRLASTQQVAHGVLLPVRMAAGLGLGVRDGRDAGEELEDSQGRHPYLRALMALPAVGRVI